MNMMITSEFPNLKYSNQTTTKQNNDDDYDYDYADLFIPLISQIR